MLPSLPDACSLLVFMMAYPHLLGLWALTFLHISFVRSLSSCNANLYGKPSVRDCFDLYDELPGGAMSANVDVDKPRSFVEPKFLEPAFCPVPNPYSTHMVQLPKVWRGGQSLLCDSSSHINLVTPVQAHVAMRL